MRWWIVVALLVSGAEWVSASCPDTSFDEFDVAPALADSVGPQISLPYLFESGWKRSTISIEVLVLDDATPCQARLLGATNAPAPFVHAAQVAAMASTYRAAIRDGLPVPGRLRIDYDYRVDLREEPPAQVVTENMVSSRGVDGGVSRFCGLESAQVFEYDGTRFHGDIALEVVRDAEAQLAERIPGDWHVADVVHWMSLPETCRDARDNDWFDLEVWAQAEQPDGTLGDEFHVYRFVNEGGRYRALPSLSYSLTVCPTRPAPSEH